jgi:hypothetical protein
MKQRRDNMKINTIKCYPITSLEHLHQYLNKRKESPTNDDFLLARFEEENLPNTYTFAIISRTKQELVLNYSYVIWNENVTTHKGIPGFDKERFSYISHSQIKETFKPEDIAHINKICDKTLPRLRHILMSTGNTTTSLYTLADG